MIVLDVASPSLTPLWTLLRLSYQVLVGAASAAERSGGRIRPTATTTAGGTQFTQTLLPLPTHDHAVDREIRAIIALPSKLVSALRAAIRCTTEVPSSYRLSLSDRARLPPRPPLASLPRFTLLVPAPVSAAAASSSRCLTRTNGNLRFYCSAFLTALFLLFLHTAIAPS